VEFNPSAIVFLIVGSVCGMLSGYFALREIEEVNRKLPQHEQIEYAFMYPGKMKRISLAYKEYYPGGTTNRWRVTFEIGSVLFMALAALAARFLR
jgi:hypothetical protein